MDQSIVTERLELLGEITLILSPSSTIDDMGERTMGESASRRSSPRLLFISRSRKISTPSGNSVRKRETIAAVRSVEEFECGAGEIGSRLVRLNIVTRKDGGENRDMTSDMLLGAWIGGSGAGSRTPMYSRRLSDVDVFGGG
jgi:hypothetical protein